MVLFSLYITVTATLLVQSFNSAGRTNFQIYANPLQEYQRIAFPQSKDSNTNKNRLNFNEITQALSRLLEKVASPMNQRKRDTIIKAKKAYRHLSRPREPSHKSSGTGHGKKRWDRWTQWSQCSVSCGKGREIRWRHCVENCGGVETEMEEKACQLPACGGKLFGIIKLTSRSHILVTNSAHYYYKKEFITTFGLITFRSREQRLDSCRVDICNLLAVNMSSATLPLLEDDTVAFGDDLGDSGVKGSLTHPYVTFFHLAFRGASIVTYLLCEWFSDSFIASFVTVVLLLSMDFWTVKNITGRLMVGLRWWNYVDDDGKSHWVFESRKNRVNEREARIFWMALVITPLLWGVFFITALFWLKLKWMLLIMIALALNGANFYGYFKCKVGSSESLSSATTNFLRKQVLQNAVSLVTREATAPQANPMSQPSNTI
ncbi:putative Golgi apparatus membrane protein-like protein CG5021 [Tribolium castaneum]|uniref:Golgi apparatus membrane protein TVP23 homolog n=2 Tax=Tribolium castaneum TaxID=7070 RepID=A0A139WLX5_TRICA|nr:putative Golgi apparatus membrane protein-like protein CG5021 [Tribolium castaneum]